VLYITGFFKISSKFGAFICAGTKIMYSIHVLILGVFILANIDVFVLRIVRKDM